MGVHKKSLKGIIWKYIADFEDEFLRDKGNCSDPDFWSNKFPVWGICAPYVRERLVKGDTIFFVPQRGKWFSEYIFTGILVMQDSINSFKDVLRSSKLNGEYKTKFQKDMIQHLRHDKGKGKVKTYDVRQRNFIIGNPDSSHWYGKDGQPVDITLRSLGLIHILNAIGRGRNQSIPHLNEVETEKIYRMISSKTKPISLMSMRNTKLVTNMHPKCLHL
ncbi:MAG: hypothetical protein PXY39_10505 [archaeon]|nr:hypothetical protein [archaeon]